MQKSTDKIIETYNNLANEGIVQIYEDIDFDRLYSPIIDFFVPPPSKLLEIGAGTGRDSAVFASRGYKVTAIEPTKNFREIAQILHKSENIKWIDDRLPELLSQINVKYEMILICAVWHHLNAKSQTHSISKLAQLLDIGGRLMISLRLGKSAKGRRSYKISAPNIISHAKNHNLKLLLNHPYDSFRANNIKDGIKWIWLVFEKE